MSFRILSVSQVDPSYNSLFFALKRYIYLPIMHDHDHNLINSLTTKVHILAVMLSKNPQIMIINNINMKVTNYYL